jgi:uncharacterized membrane protein
MNLTLAIAYFIHLVATIVWIGGLFLMVIVVWPAARRAINAQDQSGALLKFMETLRRRFTPLANLSLIALLVTGLIQMSIDPHYKGVLVIDDDWSRALFIKHIGFIGMMIVGGVMQFAVMPALDRASLLARKGRDAPDLERLQRRERQLTALNLALGLVVLLFTAIATAV